MKRAPGRRIERVGDFAGDRDARLARHLEVRDGVEQHARVRMLRTREELAGGSELHDAAEIHDADAVGDVMDDREIVRDEEIREPERVRQVAHQVQHLRLNGNVERGRRLVAYEELRVGRQRARDGDALALAAGELVRILDAVRGCETDLHQQCRHALVELRARGLPAHVRGSARRRCRQPATAG
jgi:hypothetical protein